MIKIIKNDYHHSYVEIRKVFWRKNMKMGQFCWKWPSQYFHFSSNLGKLARCPIFIHIYLSQSAIYYIPCPLPSGYFLSTLSFFPCAWVESMNNWIKGNIHCLYFCVVEEGRRGCTETILKEAAMFWFFWLFLKHARGQRALWYDWVYSVKEARAWWNWFLNKQSIFYNLPSNPQVRWPNWIVCCSQGG